MKAKTAIPTVAFGCVLVGFWAERRALSPQASVGGHVFSAFVSFALLLAAEWFFGFGLGERFAGWLESFQPGGWDCARARLLRVLAPALFFVPYLVFAIPRGLLDWRYAVGMAVFPVVLSAIVEFSSRKQTFLWHDAVVLLALALMLEFHVLSPAWPYKGLGSLPKLYLANVALYVYLVVRRIEGMGYSFVPDRRAFLMGVREWAFFLPIALGLGFALDFISFFPRHPSLGHVVGALIVVFLLTAVPEELFFRGILQNLLEARWGRRTALLVAALLFGLSHFPKGATFNWRYVILATIAGIFYGRAWRDRRRVLASSITHTLVDVVWGLWFR